MKSNKLFLITLITFIVILQSIFTTGIRKSEQVVTSSSSSSSTTSSPPKPVLEKPDIGDIWEDLFTVPRTSSCRAEINRANILAEVRADEDNKSNGGNDVLVTNSAFHWVRRWGFGPVAYLIDFFDPLFKAEIVEQFKRIHKDVMKEDPENTPEYTDTFDFAGRISTAPPERQEQLMKDLKQFEKTYDPIIFELSANSVQIMKSMRSFRWMIDPGVADFAAEFITKYDINHDGRLNPKELILGSIHYNKNIIGSKRCNHCYSKIGKKIGALFTYLDCGETGFIDAAVLWKNLPDLRRPTSQFNIFGYNNSENIRSNAVNDFILKNQHAKDAFVSKEEFVAGMLLAVWDRQVTENAIVDDDARSLKRLRWSQNNMIDTAAYNYVKAVTKKKIEEEERERYEKEKRRKAGLWAEQQHKLQ